MDSSGAFSAFLRDFNSLEARLIPGSEGAHTLFWPPDGQSLYEISAFLELKTVWHPIGT